MEIKGVMQMFSLSQASQKMMIGVHPDLVRFMEELIGLSPHDFKITCGMRTAEEQNKLYQYGRTIPGAWRTNCDGYKVQSNHQEKIDGLGYAIDIGVLVKEKTKKIVAENGKKVEKEVEVTVYKAGPQDFHYYKDIYETAKKHGLIDKYNIEWGGEWKKVDAVHFQIRGAGKIPYKVVYKK